MAFSACCDHCGCDLLGHDIRYTVLLEIAQAYDPMEVVAAEQRHELRGELEAVIQRMELLPAAEVKKIEDDSYSSFRFDLCPNCAAALREDARAFFRGMRSGVGRRRGAEMDRPSN